MWGGRAQRQLAFHRSNGHENYAQAHGSKRTRRSELGDDQDVTDNVPDKEHRTEQLGCDAKGPIRAWLLLGVVGGNLRFIFAAPPSER